MLSYGQSGPSLPVRNAGESPIRNSTSHRNRQHRNRNGSIDDERISDHGRTHDGESHQQQRYRGRRYDDRGGYSPARRDRVGGQRGHSSMPNGGRDPDVENEQASRATKRASWGGTSRLAEDDAVPGAREEAPSTAPRQQLRLSASAVDRGLAGVGESLRSSWSMSVLPAMPNGEAVPALLSHLAGGSELVGFVVASFCTSTCCCVSCLRCRRCLLFAFVRCVIQSLPLSWC